MPRSLNPSLALIVLAACEPEAGTASLSLVVSGLPDGQPASITVSGSGQVHHPTESTTFAALEEGTWTVNADPVDLWLPVPEHQSTTLNAGDHVELTVRYSLPTPTLSLEPPEATVLTGGQVNLQAISTGLQDTSLEWSVTPGTANGLVTPTSGARTAFIAFMTPGDCQVVATSLADPTLRATSVIHVVGLTDFEVIPAELVIAPGTTQIFEAFREDQSTPDVAWSLEDANPSVTISADGELYTGDVDDEFVVRATSLDEPTHTATASVTVETDVDLEIIAPPLSTFSTLDALTFYVSVNPQGIDRAVTWSIGSGSVLPVSWYYAYIPDMPGSWNLTATSVFDPTESASTSMVVEPAPGVATAVRLAMPATRTRHASAVLPDGDVLLFGGSTAQGGWDRVETLRYDAGQRTFTTRAAPDHARPGAVATPLPDGQVLVTGGVIAWNEAADNGYVYDPDSDTHVATGTMSARRTWHAMVPIAEGPHAGEVLVIGGTNGPIPYGDPVLISTDSIDLFDPDTLTFQPHARLREGRAAFSATRLRDGRVLIAGGYSASTQSPLTSAELYDPLTGQSSWTQSGLSRPRAWHTATLLPDGRVLIMSDGSAEVYLPDTETFEVLVEQPLRPRREHTATLLPDGRVLFVGGLFDPYVWGSVEVWSPTSGFSFYRGLATPRSSHSATTILTGPDAGGVLVVGGELSETLPAYAEFID